MSYHFAGADGADGIDVSDSCTRLQAHTYGGSPCRTGATGSRGRRVQRAGAHEPHRGIAAPCPGADLDEEFAKARQQECEERQRLLSGQRELISGQRELSVATRETAVALGRIAQAMESAAERVSDRAADRVLRRMMRGLAPDDGGTDFDVPPLGGCSCGKER